MWLRSKESTCQCGDVDLISGQEDPLEREMAIPGSSAGKEFACNAGDPSLIRGSRRSAGEGIGYRLQYSWASLVAQRVKNTCNVGHLSSIPGLERSPGEGNGYPLQYSFLENPMGLQRVGHG